MGSYSSVAVRDSQGNIIGYVSTSTGQVTEGVAVPSQRYQEIQQQYSSRIGLVATTGPEQSYRQGIATNVLAGEGGFTGRAAVYAATWTPLQRSRYSSELENQPSQSTVPIRDVSSNAPTRAEVLFPQNQYESMAIQNVQTRPGYTPSSSLGDTQTQMAIRAVSMMRVAGINVATPDLMAGRALETQRQAAYATPGTRDERYYSGELQKWAENKVELSSAYHHVGMDAGVPIPANRFEYQGDLAVEFLKGKPTKSSEMFSPVSGEMSERLPGGEGLQQYEWRGAIATDRGTAQPEQKSFSDAVEYLGAAEGAYGPYGFLRGGPSEIGVQTSDRVIGGKMVGRSGTSIPTEYGEPTLNVYDVYSTKSQEYTTMLAAYEAGGRTDEAMYNTLVGREKELKMLGFAKWGADVTKAQFDAVSVKTEPKQIALSGAPGPIGFAMDTSIIGINIARTGDIGAAWDQYNLAVMRQTPLAVLPDMSGISPSDISKGFTAVGTVANPMLYPVLTSEGGRATTEFVGAAGQEIYERSRTHPIEDIALAAVPGAFKIGESLVSRGIAKATVTPGLKTAGRALSTPIATDVGQYVVKGALVAPWIYESGKSIYDAPMTPAGKGKAVGYVGYQLGWMAGPGGKIAEGIKTFQPENAFYGKGFFSGKPQARPIQTAKGDITISLASAEMRLRGMPQEAAYLRSTWNVAKVTRFMESPQKNPKPLELISEVPIEHRVPLEKALTTNVVLGYGSGFSYGQMKPTQRFPDTRLADINLLQSGALKGKMMGERFEAIDIAKEPEFPLGEYPVSKGSDIDLFGDVAGVKTTLAKEPESMVQIRIPGEPGKTTSYTIVERGGERIKVYEKGYVPEGEPTYEYMPWAKAAERGYTIEDVGSIYYKGAKFALDPHEYPSGFPRLKSMSEDYRPKSDTYSKEDWRVPIAFKVLGSPFESIPRATDVMYIEKEPGKFIPQEKVGFQMQRLGDAISKNLMTGTERYPGDPLYRGYRFEKDIYRDVSYTQQLLGEQRTVLIEARAKTVKMPEGMRKTTTLKDINIREQNLRYAEKEFGKKLSLDLRYQLERGEEPVVARVSSLAEIGKERLGWGMTVSGGEIGPIRTTIGEVKSLKDYPAPAKRDIAADIAWERKFIPVEQQRLQPKSMKAKKPEGVLLEEIPYKKKSMEDILKKYKTEPIEDTRRVDTRDIIEDETITAKEPTFTREYKFGSGTTERPPAISKIGGFAPATISTAEKKMPRELKSGGIWKASDISRSYGVKAPRGSGTYISAPSTTGSKIELAYKGYELGKYSIAKSLIDVSSPRLTIVKSPSLAPPRFADSGIPSRPGVPVSKPSYLPDTSKPPSNPERPSRPELPPPPIPVGGPPIILGGGSTVSPGYRGKYSKTYINPVGADILGASRGVPLRVPSRKGFRVPKFKMPKF